MSTLTNISRPSNNRINVQDFGFGVHKVFFATFATHKEIVTTCAKFGSAFVFGYTRAFATRTYARGFFSQPIVPGTKIASGRQLVMALKSFLRLWPKILGVAVTNACAMIGFVATKFSHAFPPRVVNGITVVVCIHRWAQTFVVGRT